MNDKLKKTEHNPDSDSVDDKEQPKNVDYIRLAELQQTSFSDRRQYEWKINFAFWGSLALIVYSIVRYNIIIKCTPLHLYIIGSLLFLLFLLQILLIAYSHYVDKEWRKYYLKKAEGETLESPDILKLNTTLIWVIVQSFFTALLIYLAIIILTNNSIITMNYYCI